MVDYSFSCKCCSLFSKNGMEWFWDFSNSLGTCSFSSFNYYSNFINTKINNAVYTLPVAWAFFGILMETRRLAGKLDFGTYLNPVIIIGIVVLTIISILQFNRNNFCVVKREDK